MPYKYILGIWCRMDFLPVREKWSRFIKWRDVTPILNIYSTNIHNLSVYVPYFRDIKLCLTASLVQWPHFLVTDPQVPGSNPAPPDFLSSSASGTRSTQPRDDTWGVTWKKKWRFRHRKPRLRAVGVRCADHETSLNLQQLALKVTDHRRLLSRYSSLAG
jgi:hypothetical protein